MGATTAVIPWGFPSPPPNLRGAGAAARPTKHHTARGRAAVFATFQADMQQFLEEVRCFHCGIVPRPPALTSAPAIHQVALCPKCAPRSWPPYAHVLCTSSNAPATQLRCRSQLLTTATRAFDNGIINSWQEFMPPPGMQPATDVVITVIMARWQEGVARETAVAGIRAWSEAVRARGGCAFHDRLPVEEFLRQAWSHR